MPLSIHSVESSWYRFIKKYVWDDTKTPYFTKTDKLSKTQAGYEILFYALCLGTLFFAIAVVMLSPRGPYGPSYGAGFYAFSVVASAAMFGFTKDISTAVYSALAPLGVLLYLSFQGFPPNLQSADKVVIGVFVLLWAWYSVRIVRIAYHYEHLVDRHDPP
ncbi:MAG: hypothetical protein U1F68_06185 [Gammaproteobacteria bacterium]